MNTGRYCIEKLKTVYIQRKSRNARYSLRSFSRSLDLPPSILSEILRNKRGIPRKKLATVVERLALSPIETNEFIKSAQTDTPSLKTLTRQNTNENDFLLDQERHYRIIAKWEYYAILNLMETKSFRSDFGWIAHRLGIDKSTVATCIEDLMKADLVEKNGNAYVRVKKNLNTSYDVPSSALQASHSEYLEMAALKLKTLPVSMRYFSSTTLPLDLSKLDEIKKCYREFRNKLDSLMRKDSNSDEVFQFCFQVFPLTQVQNGKGASNET